MHYLISLPLRIVLIPLFLVVVAVMALMVPFICLFGTITYGGKDE